MDKGGEMLDVGGGGGETNQNLDKISFHFLTAFQKSTFLSQNVGQN